jgi:GNAT superfamily N-acetyltransferase
MQVKAITHKSRLRNNLILYTDNCDREAGPILAEKMKWDSFSDWEKIFVAIENDNIVGYCTFTKEDWIPNCDYTPFVWFIFIDEKCRWKRYSEKLINAVEEYAKTLNFKQLYIVSDHKWLYEKYWFEKYDTKTDELWRTETIFKREINYDPTSQSLSDRVWKNR